MIGILAHFGSFNVRISRVAVYPTFAASRSQLMRSADAALYEIKLHGKNGCMAYREGLQSGIRKQLGFGYKDMDELFKLTNKRFRNLILKDEQKQIESSIWEQIDSGNENDYIHFHLRKADGSYLSVLDHGRIVESQQYGRVFYVLFMDWEDMHIHYSNKFSG